MEQLIFVGVIVAFTILDAVLRGKKKGAEGSDGLPVPLPQDPWAAAAWEVEEPTYDADPAYDVRGPHDDEASHDDRALQEIAVRSEPQAPGSMSVKELWEEVAGLSASRLRPHPMPTEFVPQGEESLPVPPSSTKVAEHRIHRSHAGYGTDPSTRARSAEDGLDPLARHLGKDAALARLLLSSGNAHSLRQAIILQELLGPPAAYRE